MEERGCFRSRKPAFSVRRNTIRGDQGQHAEWQSVFAVPFTCSTSCARASAPRKPAWIRVAASACLPAASAALRASALRHLKPKLEVIRANMLRDSPYLAPCKFKTAAHQGKAGFPALQQRLSLRR